MFFVWFVVDLLQRLAVFATPVQLEAVALDVESGRTRLSRDEPIDLRAGEFSNSVALSADEVVVVFALGQLVSHGTIFHWDAADKLQLVE